jgi:hypothetical protein
MKAWLCLVVVFGIVIGSLIFVPCHIAAESYNLPKFKEALQNPTYYHCFLLGRCYQIGMYDGINRRGADFKSFFRTDSFLKSYFKASPLYPELMKEFEQAYETGFLDGSQKQ